nr:MAG TPA: hypothetical protein [Caudoviricetes sp.]
MITKTIIIWRFILVLKRKMNNCLEYCIGGYYEI